MARGYGKKQVVQRPEGAIRRSQMVGAFGPGATIDLLDQAVLVGGLDFWHYGKSIGNVIEEPRLRDSIVEKFRGAGIELSVDDPFREPPIGSDRDPTRAAGVRVLEFPQWFVCQSSSCRALVRKEGLDLKGGRYFHQCLSGKRAFETVPVRFIGACTKGHLMEWPWILFAHANHREGRCAAPQLSLHEGATGDFSEIELRCACGATNKLIAATGGFELQCDGQRPWLGPEGREECDQAMRLLVRTASNSYFAQIMSALSIPEPERELEAKVRSVWDVLKAATTETLSVFRNIPKVQIAIADHDDASVMRVVNAMLKDLTPPRDPLRTAEYKQLVAAKPERPGEMPKENEQFFARTCTPRGGLPVGIARLVLAAKLREVRAQIGFTRIEAVTPDMQGEYDLGVKSARLGLTTNWLPATEILGEGVFVELAESDVRAWEERDAVKERDAVLKAGYAQWANQHEGAPPFPGVRFYLLHSLSHLLITAISLECGYSASAIRERIYAGPSAADMSTPMAAVLLHTGSSGTEGTLGGLVDQGRRLRAHLQRAYDLGKLCSNDPVCATHSPEKDLAERYLEGAACHGCLFIAETSCERFNRYLDRALVVPTVGHPSELAFFGKRP